jgi:hypothetical protein
MSQKKLPLTASLAAIVAVFLFAGILFHPLVCHGEGAKWSGVDESVVEKYAKEHGREARAPLINTDRGDLLLFVFLLAGALGGFVAGYYWRTLMDQKNKALPEERTKTS